MESQADRLFRKTMPTHDRDNTPTPNFQATHEYSANQGKLGNLLFVYVSHPEKYNQQVCDRYEKLCKRKYCKLTNFRTIIAKQRQLPKPRLTNTSLEGRFCQARSKKQASTNKTTGTATQM